MTTCPTCSFSYDPQVARGLCPRCSLSGALFSSQDATGRVELLPGGGVGHFELLDELGRGAMGRVWLARDTQLDRLVALKTLTQTNEDSSLLSARLEREARTAAALHHSGIVAIHGLGRVRDIVWLAMEFAEGGDLRKKLQNSLLPVAEAARLGAKLARALAAAHAAGILHRDLKPSNILLDEHGEPKLADFGLATPIAGAGDLTMTGQILGTPAYLAPENLQATGNANFTAAADIYSLGAVIYEMLVGRPPFVGDNTNAILAAVAASEPVPPGRLRAGLPRDLETIVLKCLEKEPSRRYASANDLAADLESFLAGRAIVARPLSAVGRVLRWTRREPGLAISLLIVVSMLIGMVLVSTAAAVRVDRARAEALAKAQLAGTEAARANAAEAKLKEELREALLAQAKATRLTGRPGQRFDTLAKLQEAAAIKSGPDLRAEAIIALTLPDFRLLNNDVHVRDNPSQNLGFDVGHDRFAVEAQPGQVEVRDLARDQLLGKLGGDPGKLRLRPFFSDDGRYVGARTAAGRVFVWSAVTFGEPAFTLDGRPYDEASANSFYGVPDAFSPDGKWFASAVEASGFTLHELPSGREVARVATTQPVTHLVFSRDSRQLAIGGGIRQVAGFLAVAAVAKPQDLHVLPFKDVFQTIDWSADGTRLFAGVVTWNVIDATSGAVLTSVRDAEAAHGFFGPDDSTAWTISRTGAVRLWDLRSGDVLLRASVGRGVDVALSPDRRRILRNISPSSMCEYQLETPAGSRTWPAVHPVLDNATRNGSMLCFTTDGRWLVQSVNGAIHLRDGVTGAWLDSCKLGTRRDLSSALWAPDNTTIYAGSGGIGLMRVPVIFEEGKPPHFGPAAPIDPEPDFVVADISPDGKRLILIGGKEGPGLTTPTVKVLTIDGSVAPVTWRFPLPTRAVFVNHGANVLVNGYTGMGKLPLELYDAATGKSVRDLGMTQGYEVSRSADSRWVAIGTGAKSAGLWRTADWTPGPALPKDLQGAFNTTTFSPDGTLVAIATGAQISLVRVTDGGVIVTLQAAQSGTYMTDLQFSPDGKRLVAQWIYGPLTMWNLPDVHQELGKLGLDW
jgi:WD40 repeat protein